MSKPGRVSAAQMAVAPLAGPVQTIARPDAPYDLTDRQSAIWWAVVNRLPADWLPRETHDVLAQYCRHVAAAERVALLVLYAETDGETVDIGLYDQVLRMQERESRAIASLATKLRMTKQATVSEYAKKPYEGKKPWEC